ACARAGSCRRSASTAAASGRCPSRMHRAVRASDRMRQAWQLLGQPAPAPPKLISSAQPVQAKKKSGRPAPAALETSKQSVMPNLLPARLLVALGADLRIGLLERGDGTGLVVVHLFVHAHAVF